jgi:hypothetical protein
MSNQVQRLTECIAPRGSFTSDKQKFSSYPFAFDTNCPYGVSDKEIIDKNNIKVCQPHLPPFQNQYTIHSHFQDLFLKPDCPSCGSSEEDVDVCPTNCIGLVNGSLNNNPQTIQQDCLYVDPVATQFASIPLPVCVNAANSTPLAVSTYPGSINNTQFVRSNICDDSSWANSLSSLLSLLLILFVLSRILGTF